MLDFFQTSGLDLIKKAGEHLLVSMSALSLGILIAIPIGVLIINHKKLSQFIISICSIFQTIPSLALLAIMVPIFGVGKLPAIIALFIYSLLPILRNTYLGMVEVDANILDSAKGMGMTKAQIILKVQLPLALPVIMAGVRLSAVYVIGWATIASYVGAGGLGDYIFAGLTNFNFYFIIFATLFVTCLALLSDVLLSVLEKRITPKTTSDKKEGVSHV